MKAAVLLGKENLKLMDVPKPKCKPDEALIAVKSCGLCGTDIHAYHGDFMPTFPLILGHEFSGVVEELGSEVSEYQIGDRVSVSPDYYCHSCYNCRKGSERFCSNWSSIGTTVDGAFAEYIAVRKDALYHIPDTISFDEASLLEPASCVYSGIREVSDYYDKKVMILGAGAIGLIWLTLLRAKNPLCIDMIDMDDKKLTYAQSIGANEVYNTTGCKDGFYEVVKKKYDVVVDCTGVPSVLEKGFSLLDKEATFIFFGVNPTKAKITVSPFDVYVNTWKIVGVYPDMKSFGTIIQMLDKKIVDFKPLISHRFALGEFEKAFDFFMNNTLQRRKIIIYNE